MESWIQVSDSLAELVCMRVMWQKDLCTGPEELESIPRDALEH